MRTAAAAYLDGAAGGGLNVTAPFSTNHASTSTSSRRAWTIGSPSASLRASSAEATRYRQRPRSEGSFCSPKGSSRHELGGDAREIVQRTHALHPVAMARVEGHLAVAESPGVGLLR